MTLKHNRRLRDRLRAVLRVGRRGNRPIESAAFSVLTPMPAWDDAFARVESYLRAHHIESRLQLIRLTTEIIQTARMLSAEEPDTPPVTLAMRVAHARIGDWLVRVIGEGDWDDERFRARGRLALLRAGVPHEHPELFLADDPVPPDVVTRLQAARLQPGPELSLTSMPAAPLDLPAVDEADQSWETLSRSVLFRASASWVLFVGALGVLWATSR